MQLYRGIIGRLTNNVIHWTLLLTLSSFTFVGCVKPAASSSLIQNTEKGPETAVENPMNTGDFFASEEPSLPPKYYSDLVKKYSDRYHLDWPLVLAVMKQESRFDQTAVSHVGAYGLMQIMPLTQTELVDKLGVADAATPRNNIRAGVYHLRSMYRAFPKATGSDRIELALSAYNAGLKRVIAARDIARYLGEDPNDWESIKSTLPLLSKSYYSLHKDVWHKDKPPCGYFNGYRQTLTYVDNIMSFYDGYSLALK